MKKNNIQKMPKEPSAGNGTKPHVASSTVKPDCNCHVKEVAGINDMALLAEMVGDLHYETLADFLVELQCKFIRDAGKDEMAGRLKLAECLDEAAAHTNWVAAEIKNAWEISQPFMKGK